MPTCFLLIVCRFRFAVSDRLTMHRSDGVAVIGQQSVRLDIDEWKASHELRTKVRLGGNLKGDVLGVYGGPLRIERLF